MEQKYKAGDKVTYLGSATKYWSNEEDTKRWAEGDDIKIEEGYIVKSAADYNGQQWIRLTNKESGYEHPADCFTPVSEKLPEVYWVELKGCNGQELIEFKKWYNANHQKNAYCNTNYYRVPANVDYASGSRPTTETVITFKEWKEKINNKEMKKIIGYKAPYNINSAITKDTLYTNDGGRKTYCPKGKEGQGSYWYLPPEIVENWEPVYEEEKITIGKYVAEYPGSGIVKFGCQEFSREIVGVLLHMVRSGDIGAKISIQGVDLNEQMLKSILSQIK